MCFTDIDFTINIYYGGWQNYALLKTLPKLNQRKRIRREANKDESSKMDKDEGNRTAKMDAADEQLIS